MNTPSKKSVPPILYVSHAGPAVAFGDADFGEMSVNVNKLWIESGK